MHRKYAKGTVAIGFCDRCGFEYLLDELKVQITDNKATAVLVCKQCLDSDNPQLQLGRIPLSPNEVIVKPSPDQALDSSREMTVTLEDKTVSFVAVNTNKISDRGAGTAVDSTVFKTSDVGIFVDIKDKSLVRTTNAEFSSLCNDAGIIGSAFDLDVSSAKLRVGADAIAQTYTNPGATTNAYRVITDYDPTSVTWSSFGNGGTAGTNYTTEGSVSGSVGDYYVEWDFTEMVVDWLSGKNPNLGIFFPDMSTSLLGSSTPRANVVWTITAKRKLF